MFILITLFLFICEAVIGLDVLDFTCGGRTLLVDAVNGLLLIDGVWFLGHCDDNILLNPPNCSCIFCPVEISIFGVLSSGNFNIFFPSSSFRLEARLLTCLWDKLFELILFFEACECFLLNTSSLRIKFSTFSIEFFSFCWIWINETLGFSFSYILIDLLFVFVLANGNSLIGCWILLDIIFSLQWFLFLNILTFEFDSFGSLELSTIFSSIDISIGFGFFWSNKIDDNSFALIFVLRLWGFLE